MKLSCWFKGFSVFCLLLAMSGCVTEEITSRGPVEEIDKQKVLVKQIDLGFRYIGRNNLEKARFHLSKALNIDPKSARANTGFALIYNKEGESELADKHFRRALSGSGKNTQARFYYAVFLLEKQRIDEARAQLAKVTKDVDFNNRALAFLSLGQVETKLGNAQAARAAFDKALRLNGNMALAYLEIAELEYTDGNYQNSFNYLSNYRRLVPRPNARSLWLGVRVEHRRNNRDAEDSYGLALEKMFPGSKENLAYQQWRKRR
ncbi:type IV pilus biogenesis/stability protein PilW [Porticoccus sp. W117]|uniref:type IV pilus biogenesis/stability protein PilW n=1 Tax=Porticoccus sp. W117 TaxID=3054777 RepID=UPI002599A043|nr:type IV pilus biogenesis/stability protein PilW [Porticoccus sp. W117]MDM3870127.1 type IV pilus biogenesis/stability protein PilW [Porticoccus sp. W117]